MSVIVCETSTKTLSLAFHFHTPTRMQLPTASIAKSGFWSILYTRTTYNKLHCMYKARHAHKRLYTVLPKYSKIQVLPGITSCRLVKDNKQAIELNSLLSNNMPKDGYG